MEVKVGREYRVAWFSSGVSSAVAIKKVISEIDKIYYIHIDDQHEDTSRFVKDCEEWFGKPVERMKSKLKCVENACLMAGGKGYINGRNGASCTERLKRKVRKVWESENKDKNIIYYWGMDLAETDRAEKLIDHMPEFKHRFPLIENNIGKKEAHEILNASGIKRPKMYDLGYYNNNCVGCVKGGKGYWNKIRIDFPDVFKRRAELERKIGATCIKDKDGRVYLDELEPDTGRKQKPIIDDCGIFCEIIGM